MGEINELISQYLRITMSTVKGVSASGVTGEFWHYYYKKGVSQRYWIKLITQMEAVTQ